MTTEKMIRKQLTEETGEDMAPRKAFIKDQVRGMLGHDLLDTAARGHLCHAAMLYHLQQQRLLSQTASSALSAADGAMGCCDRCSCSWQTQRTRRSRRRRLPWDGPSLSGRAPPAWLPPCTCRQGGALVAALFASSDGLMQGANSCL